MGVIHFGCSGGSAGAWVDSDGLALGATLATGAGTGAGCLAARSCGRSTFTYPKYPPAPAPASKNSQRKARPTPERLRWEGGLRLSGATLAGRSVALRLRELRLSRSSG